VKCDSIVLDLIELAAPVVVRPVGASRPWAVRLLTYRLRDIDARVQPTVPNSPETSFERSGLENLWATAVTSQPLVGWRQTTVL